jgi:hypothetical protein
MNALRVVLALAVLGCGGVARGPGAEPREPGYLVVVPEGDGLRTEWRDAEGRLHGRAGGALLGIADRLYRFESRTESVALRPCEELLGGGTNDEPGARGTIASAVLVGIGGAESLVLSPSPGDGGLQDFAQHEMSHRLLAAHGRRLVVLTERVRSACGAHGERQVAIDTFDLASGARRAPRASAALEARRTEVLEAMRRLDPARSAACLTEAALEVRWVTSGPGYAAGRVRARHLFAAGPVPYACGPLTGAPSASYEWGTWLDGEASELDGWGPEDEVPAAVLVRASDAGAIGITWLDAARAPMADGFAIAHE